MYLLLGRNHLRNVNRNNQIFHCQYTHIRKYNTISSIKIDSNNKISKEFHKIEKEKYNYSPFKSSIIIISIWPFSSTPLLIIAISSNINLRISCGSNQVMRPQNEAKQPFDLKTTLHIVPNTFNNNLYGHFIFQKAIKPSKVKMSKTPLQQLILVIARIHHGYPNSSSYQVSKQEQEVKT